MVMIGRTEPVTKRAALGTLIACFVGLFALPVDAGDWLNWRGPNYDGSADATGLPDRWSADENVLWFAPMPGPAGATPIVSGTRVFVSSFDQKSEDVLALCIDRDSGKRLWTKVLGKGQSKQKGGNENYMAGPSPVSDGKRVFFMTGQGDLVGFDVSGEEHWRTNIQEKQGGFNIMWGYASSPLLVDGKLFVQVLHRSKRYPYQRPYPLSKESFLLAVDPSRGSEIFRHVRDTEAVDESREAYSTPIPRKVGKRWEIMILGGDCLTSHDARDGRELWRFDGWNATRKTNWRHVPSPVVAGGLVCASTPYLGPVHAVRVEEATTSETKLRRVWSMDRDGTDVPTPLAYRGKLYVLCGKKRRLTCLDPATGRRIWSEKLPADRYMRASPTAADGKIFCITADGEAFAIAAGPKFKILNHAKMGGYPARSSIVIADNKLFIRTAKTLYCVGKRGAE